MRQQQMALPASSFTPLTHQISFCKNQLCFRGVSQKYARSYSTSVSCSVKLPTMDHFHDSSSFKLHLRNVKGKILELVPDSIKEFPWKKAENVALQQLLILGQEALKWSLFAVVIWSFISDVTYSIARNKELIVPFGLLIGCLIVDFFKDTPQQLFDNSKEKNKIWHLMGILCLFILVKSISVYFPIGGRVLVSQATNGALLQVLWHLKSSPEVGRDLKENNV